MNAYSQEKAAKRFLTNKWTYLQTHYFPYIQALLIGLAEKTLDQGLYLVIDGSKMGKDHMALMLSVVYGKRSIPLVWLVEKKPKGHFGTKKHIELLEDVLKLLKDQLPSDLALTLLGDGEFDSVEIQEFCRSNGWNYVLRTACDTVFYEQNQRFQPKDLQVDPQLQRLFIPNVDFSERRLKNVNFLLWHEPKYENPLPLVSNLREPIEISEAYDRRYAIEALFKDLKSNSFNLHKTRLRP
ncbi:MAG: transposase [Bacteroidia bacterium]